jgi:hypothetical protein
MLQSWPTNQRIEEKIGWMNRATSGRPKVVDSLTFSTIISQRYNVLEESVFQSETGVYQS